MDFSKRKVQNQRKGTFCLRTSNKGPIEISKLRLDQTFLKGEALFES
jgi:hypothetical protein